MMQTSPDTDRPPATLPPRGAGLRQRIWAGLGFLMFAAALVAMVVFVGPALISDWQISATAQPAERGRIVKGSCTTKLVVALCDVAMSNRTPAGIVTRSVHYVFIDVHFGDYSAEVMADPARPDLVTTDLGLDRLWNRTLTFLGAFVLFLGFVTLPLVAFFRNRRAARAV